MLATDTTSCVKGYIIYIYGIKNLERNNKFTVESLLTQTSAPHNSRFPKWKRMIHKVKHDNV